MRRRSGGSQDEPEAPAGGQPRESRGPLGWLLLGKKSPSADPTSRRRRCVQAAGSAAGCRDGRRPSFPQQRPARTDATLVLTFLPELGLRLILFGSLSHAVRACSRWHDFRASRARHVGPTFRFRWSRRDKNRFFGFCICCRSSYLKTKKKFRRLHFYPGGTLFNFLPPMPPPLPTRLLLAPSRPAPDRVGDARCEPRPTRVRPRGRCGRRRGP